MEMIGQGNTAQIYEYGEGKILKLFRTGIDDVIASGEYDKACTAYEVLGEKVPKVYGKAEYEKRFGIIYEKVEGKDMLKMMLSDLFHVKRYSRQLAQYHVSIQQETDKALPTVKEKLKADIEAVSDLDEKEKRQIGKVLSALPEGKTLCHFDFHPGNIMIRKNKPVILDWMTACVGNPCADAARTCMMLQYAEIPRVPGIINFLFHVIKKRIFHFYLSEYLKLTGFSEDKIKEWYLPIMVARLREWIPGRERERLVIEIKEQLQTDIQGRSKRESGDGKKIGCGHTV